MDGCYDVPLHTYNHTSHGAEEREGERRKADRQAGGEEEKDTGFSMDGWMDEAEGWLAWRGVQVASVGAVPGLHGVAAFMCVRLGLSE
mmetsp:Transcript_51604/g.129658  ORF Transcript_51604/g.129658 Transcript_51604/m.129658 type:complete len:88 (+) Transcript_51604:832-1095(+)